MTEPRYSDHYIKNHLGKPHEYLVSGINPLTQQKENQKDETAYTFFYIALIVGVVLFILMLFGMCRNYKETKDFVNEVQIRENERREKEKLRKKSTKKDESTFTTATITTSTSTPSMTTTTEEVQPPSGFHGTRFETPHRGQHTNITVEPSMHNNNGEERGDFGRFNSYHQNNSSSSPHTSLLPITSRPHYQQPSYPDLRPHQQQLQQSYPNLQEEELRHDLPSYNNGRWGTSSNSSGRGDVQRRPDQTNVFEEEEEVSDEDEVLERDTEESEVREENMPIVQFLTGMSFMLDEESAISLSTRSSNLNENMVIGASTSANRDYVFDRAT